MPGLNVFSRKDLTQDALPNRWDVVAFLLLLIVLMALAWGGKAMVTPYKLGDPIPIALDPHHLPLYAWRSFLRMLLGLLASLVFTGIFGTWAAKSSTAERVIIPLIDVLQAVPVLGFLSISVWGFVHLFPNSLLGPEIAAIFAVFTSQAWNITLSFYQSLKTLPQSLVETAHSFQLTAWQRFWRIEVPHAIPGLVWNSMVSMSAGWFFVVASEAIDIANQPILLPGIGSYIATAIERADHHAMLYAVLTMFTMVWLFDQWVFRPLVIWSRKFYLQADSDDVQPPSWMLKLWTKTQWLHRFSPAVSQLRQRWVNVPLGRQPSTPLYRNAPKATARPWLETLVMLITLAGLGASVNAFGHAIPWHEVGHVTWLGAITACRITVLIGLCTLIWTPVGVWIGQRPVWTARLQPVIQIFASFPANLLFPFVVSWIVRYRLNVDVWTSPLIVLGTQWYILFNVIAGTAALPKAMLYAVRSLGLTRWQRWKRMILPGIFPYLITGMISAAGGAWNTSIIAESVSWGSTHLTATGLGSYITVATQQGAFGHLALGILVMCGYVLIFNRVLWQPLYNLAAERFTAD